jgi:hypothetical protein
MSDQPDQPDHPEPVTLATLHEETTTSFLVVVDNAYLARNPELAELLPAAFGGSEAPSKRVGLLSASLRMLEAGAAKKINGEAQG